MSAISFLDTQAATPNLSNSDYKSYAYPYPACSIDTSAYDSGENLKVSRRNRRLRHRS
jgi:hypothetical protein